MPRSPATPERSEQRRLQVLDAARLCFERHGFHGASMDKISKTAGMSVGHIYHYFENKEAIIEAMVEGDLARIATDFVEIRAQDDVAAAMIEHASHIMANPQGMLRVEMLAEATRNPRIATIVQSAHAKIRGVIVEAIRHANPQLNQAEAMLRFEVLSALVAGLDWSIVRSPEIDRAAMIQELMILFRQVIARLPH